MYKESFAKKLRRGDTLIGTSITLPSPEIAEILSNVGFDWLFIDTEHSTLDVHDVQRILQAANENCPCIVRAPLNDEVWIKKLLDTGADGIIIPLVNSADEAQKIVKLCKYPPEGNRSVGMSRAHKYGMKFQEYVDCANEKVALILQIEHIDAVQNIDSIISVPGVDAVFVGPYDLSGSMGKVGAITDPEVQQRIEIVKTVCLNAGMPIGIFGIDTEAVKPYIEQKYSMITVGIDTLFLGKSARDTLKAIRG